MNASRPRAPAGARLAQGSQNRSLERGLEILRAFRPGTDLLGNGELAERTGLAPATVSRLTQTLVLGGFLQHDARARAYRLAPAVLSLGHAMRAASPVLKAATPLMREASGAYKLNVGLASADRAEMVYLESIRYNRRASLRTVVAGQRVPVELTSLGRAYLARLGAAARSRLLADIGAGYRAASWRVIAREIAAAVRQVETAGYCTASWQPGVVALATPLPAAGHAPLVMNFSLQTDEAPASVARSYAQDLLALADGVARAIEREAAGGAG